MPPAKPAAKTPPKESARKEGSAKPKTPPLAASAASGASSKRAASPSQRGGAAASSARTAKKGGAKKTAAKKKEDEATIAEEAGEDVAESLAAPATEPEPATEAEVVKSEPAPEPEPATAPTEAANPAPAKPAPAKSAPVGDKNKPWTTKAYGLFDRIDVDGSGLIDREELMAKLRADDEFEALLGVKGAVATATVEEGPPDQVKAGKAAQAKAREQSRTAMLKTLFEEFDTDFATKKWRDVGASPPKKGREITTSWAPGCSELAQALTGDKDGKKKRLRFSREELDDFGLRELRHDDYIKVGATCYMPAQRDDRLNRNEFRELVRLGRIRMIFNGMDRDGSGNVDRTELAAKLKADAELEDLLGYADVSGIRVYTSFLYVHKAFEFDSDNNKELSRDEFESLLTQATEKAKEEAAVQQAAADASAAVTTAVEVS